jgi:hypothetical protein
MITQVISIVTMLARYCLRIFIGENLSFALEANNTPFSDRRYLLFLRWGDNLFDVDVFITMAAWHRHAIGRYSKLAFAIGA